MADVNIATVSVKLDRSEYSRFEPSRAIIRATITALGALNPGDPDATPDPIPPFVETIDPAENVVVTLRRRSGDGQTQTVATVTLSFAGQSPAAQVAEFDLRTIKDSSGLPLCIRGDYSVVAVSQRDSITASSTLLVNVITVEEFRLNALYGMTTSASERITAVVQPGLLTGIAIGYASEKVLPSTPVTLSIDADADPKTIRWGTGPVTTLTSDGEQVVMSADMKRYLRVTVDFDALPASGVVAETILLDKEQMSDAYLRQRLKEALDELESVVLHTWVEPRRIATKEYFNNPLADEYFDVCVPAVGYFSETAWNSRSQGFYVNLPVHQLQRIDELTGWLGNAKMLQILSGGYHVNKVAGQVDVLPYNFQYATFWTFFGTINFWGLRDTIPNFWQYKGVAGIADDEFLGEILEFVRLTAAVEVKVQAGSAYRAGISSESNSKDGVSRSRSYTSSATYGIYSADIDAHNKRLDYLRPLIRNKYRGITMVVM